MKTETVKLSQMAVNDKNPRTITEQQFKKLVNSILIFPKMLELRPIVVDDMMKALGGNMRYRALSAIAEMSPEGINSRLSNLGGYRKRTEGEREVLKNFWAEWLQNPTATIIKASELSEEEQREFIIKDNVGYGDWDTDALADEWDSEELDEWGLDLLHNDWDTDGEGDSSASGTAANGGAQNGSLQDRFIVPPFSILDTRKGYWQARKKMWRALIGDMGESRKDTLITSPEIKYKDLYLKTRADREKLGISFREYLDKYVSDEVKEREANKVLSQGVSLYDPVLAEVLCKWFTPKKNDKIFDCFAGDTQKGLVFGMCGYEFYGVELRQEQVDINNRVISERKLPVTYVCDDGQNVAQHIKPQSQDLLFSCPPYFDLEVYSDLPNDASNQGSYEDFIKILRNAFTAAVGCLKNNRFAVITIGDMRNKKTGCYYDFQGDIIKIFEAAGMYLYNEIILVETGASTALRASRYMDSRKVGKMHQNVLVFYKGDTTKIKDIFPKIEYSPEEEQLFEQETAADTSAADDNEQENSLKLTKEV